MAYLGRVKPTETTSSVLRSTYTGNGSTTTYALPGPVANETSIIATINGVTQQDAAYSTDGSNIVFVSAPASGDEIEIRTLSAVAMSYAPMAGSVVTGILADGAVTTGKINNSAVTTDKIADSSITTAKIAAGAVVQADIGTNVAGTGPAFYVSPTADTTVSSATDVVIANGIETFDTANCFNNTGSTVGGIPAYAFLPTVAGYYLFTSTINTELSTSPTRFINSVRTNGSTSYRVVDTSYAFSPAVSSGSILIYMNGTTDYVQQVIYLAASTPRYSASITTARFSGFLVKAA